MVTVPSMLNTAPPRPLPPWRGPGAWGVNRAPAGAVAAGEEAWRRRPADGQVGEEGGVDDVHRAEPVEQRTAQAVTAAAAEGGVGGEGHANQVQLPIVEDGAALAGRAVVALGQPVLQGHVT